MLSKYINPQLAQNLLNTVIICVTFLIAYLVFRLLLLRKAQSHKEKKRIEARLQYVLVLLFLIFIAKTWVVGFTHLFYALSLVSVGLVVTNKETIMNFVGWVVITWRGLFAEGDYVQLGAHSGFVYELGILYFKILQSSEHFTDNITGKMIKIPNGLVITNPVINYSLSSNLLEATQTWFITPGSDVKLALQLLTKNTKAIVGDYYKDNNRYTLKKLKPLISRKINLDINIKMALRTEKPPGIELTICYYCFPKDRDILDKKLFMSNYLLLEQQDSVTLAFAS